VKTRVPHEQDSSFQGIGVEAKRASSGAWSRGRPPTRPKHPASPAQAPCCGSAGTEWLEPSPGFHDEPDLARTEGGFRCNRFFVIGRHPSARPRGDPVRRDVECALPEALSQPFRHGRALQPVIPPWPAPRPARLRYWMHSRIAGTGPAWRGSHVRAASRTPSGIGIH